MKITSFTISSDDCAIVSAIYREGSLRKAALALNLDIAGVSRKAQRISEQHQVLAKINGKWSVTDSGLGLLSWMDRSIKEQNIALNLKQTIKIASTPWFAEVIILPNLSKLSTSSLNSHKISIQTPTKPFELALIEKEVDLVLSCHPPNNPIVSHKRIAQEEWITIVPYSWKKEINNTPSLCDFLKSKVLIRHTAINYNIIYPGSDHFIGEGEVIVNQLSSVRAGVSSGNGWGCCPRLLINDYIKLKKVHEIDLPVHFNNHLCIWWLRERKDIKKSMMDIFTWVKENI